MRWNTLSQSLADSPNLDAQLREDLERQCETISTEMDELRTERDEAQADLIEQSHNICALTILRRMNITVGKPTPSNTSNPQT